MLIHAFEHFGAQHIGTGEAEENIFAGHGIGQYALAVVGNGVMFFRFIHALFVFARLVNHAFRITHGNVFALHAQSHQQIQAGNRRCAGAGAHQSGVFDVFAHHAQAVEHGGGGDDGGAVLVIVKHGNVAALAQLFLDIKAFGRFDVFEVDAAESRLQRGDNVDDFIGIGFVHFQIKHINAGEFFKQHAFAFHHGLAGQRADIAQAEHGGAVGNHRHQIAAGGVFIGSQRVVVDFHAGCRHAGRISQRQIVLGGQGLGGGDLDFARIGIFVEMKRGFFD